ncbi:MAG: hypothetical protein AMJ38_03145 [Dehalococcoidia bacterium DG_22]|nr:MAG: hypothetical protein AMJ38_03145 [Dehalococcoidia bacterium DG_22]
MGEDSRFAERYDERVEKGARREVERRRLMRQYMGPGGKPITRAEKGRYFQWMAFDPEGIEATEFLRRAQKEEGLPEGSTEVPASAWAQILFYSERILGHPLAEG